MELENLEIYNETKNISDSDMSFLSLKFLQIKNKILGPNFELAISILDSKNSLKINKKQRKQNYIPNTLSFKYSPFSGEIVLTPDIIQKDTYDFTGEQTLLNKMIYLFIHSCLHLKNLDHGLKMEKLEEKYCNLFIK